MFKSNIETNSEWNKISQVVLPDLWTEYYSYEKKHQYRFDIFKLMYYYSKYVKITDYLKSLDVTVNLNLSNMYINNLGSTVNHRYNKINMVNMFKKIYEKPRETTYTCNMMKLSPSDKMYNT